MTASPVLRTPPATAVEAWIRDVPRDCICRWVFYTTAGLCVRITPRDGCPWHGRDHP